jgi:hypothetical protein
LSRGEELGVGLSGSNRAIADDLRSGHGGSFHKLFSLALCAERGKSNSKL